MPRPRRCRRVWFQPGVTFFKPAGIRLAELGESVLTVDEFEAIRLKDFQNLEQEEAAKKMNISQPTFNRLLLSARKKIADALVNGKAIRIEGGNFKIVGGSIMPEGDGRGPMGAGRGRRGRRGFGFGGPPVSCFCPSCSYQAEKQRGVPCSSMKCPKCGTLMVRGD